MKNKLRSLFGLAAILLTCGFAGCYQRTVAPSYQSDATEVNRIREQLGVNTPEKEFTNEEEEEGDE